MRRVFRYYKDYYFVRFRLQASVHLSSLLLLFP